MKTALIQLTHKKAIDFLREMEEADLIRVLNISRFEEEKPGETLADTGPYGYIHESLYDEDLSPDFPGSFPPAEGQNPNEDSPR